MSILQLGFRPFYALASIFAIIAMLIWLSSLMGVLDTGVAGMAWHSHEMLFGFGAAVIAGFLLTAVQNWTGLATPQGIALALMAAVWIAARVLMLAGSGATAAMLDVLFLPILAVAIAAPILRSRNTRNYKVLLIVIALASTHAVLHLAELTYLPGWLARAALFASIDIVIILMALVGGRIIPAFTNNAVKNAAARHELSVEVLTFVSMVLLLLVTTHSGFGTIPASVTASLCIVVAASHATRLALWNPICTSGNPLLWMLPVAYGWIPVAFLLRGLAAMNIVSPGAWIHAIMTGAVSGLMLAMMMRSALGHTGRTLTASRADTGAFLLLQLAAVVRISASVMSGETYLYWVVASGILWSLAFLIFAIRYIPFLCRPRLPR